MTRRVIRWYPIRLPPTPRETMPLLKKPTRRHLLRFLPDLGEIARELDTVAGLLGGRRTVLHVARRAMACQFEVLLPAGREDWASAAVLALNEVERIESILSIFRPDSELSNVNRLAASPVGMRVSEELFAFLERCRSLWTSTEGAFDPACGALSEVWGFKQRSPRRPSEAEIAAASHVSGFRHLRLESSQRRVHLTHAGVTINPGAVGKGWAIDRAIAMLRDSGVDNALIHAGGSSIRAIGPGPDDQFGWTVALPRASSAATGPHRSGETVVRSAPASLTTTLLNQSLATSGAGEQYFESDGITYCHVIDPRTGQALRRRGALSVKAAFAADADALSTALFVMNSDERVRFLNRNVDITVFDRTEP